MPVSRKLKARIYGGRSRRRRNKVARKPKPRKNKSNNNVAGAFGTSRPRDLTPAQKAAVKAAFNFATTFGMPPKETRQTHSAPRQTRQRRPAYASTKTRRRTPPKTAWAAESMGMPDSPPPDNPTLKSTADFKTADGDERSIDDIIVKLTREIITRKLIGATLHIKKLEDALTRLQEFKTDFYYK